MPAQFAWFFLSFRGRISRQEFWLGYVFTLAIMLVIVPSLQDISLALSRPAGRPWYRDEIEMALLLGRTIASLIILWPLLALYVKRLHDLDFSGWWLVGFIAATAAVESTGLVPKGYLSVAWLRSSVSYAAAAAITGSAPIRS